jgi:hypothetical protein
MRTTLDIDDDVLMAAKELARRDRKTAGQVLSELARKALAQPQGASPDQPPGELGFRPFGKRGGIVTNETVDRLREEDAY